MSAGAHCTNQVWLITQKKVRLPLNTFMHLYICSKRSLGGFFLAKGNDEPQITNGYEWQRCLN